MKPAFFSFTVILSILFVSCKKDKEIEPPPIPETYADYSKLKVGNYWVYEHFEVDSNGNSTPLNVFDTCFVEKDTMINGTTYYKIYRPYWHVAIIPEYNYIIIRDSLHYIVNSNGEIIFSSQDFSTVFSDFYYLISSNDTAYYTTKKMTDKDMIISTPAGTFATSNSRDTYYMYPPWSNFGNVRNKNTRYAENIGIVSETFNFFINSPLYTERRLVSYSLN